MFSWWLMWKYSRGVYPPNLIFRKNPKRRIFYISLHFRSLLVLLKSIGELFFIKVLFDLAPTIDEKYRGKCFNCRQTGHGHHDCLKLRRIGYYWSRGAENGPNPTCRNCNRYWPRSRSDQINQKLPIVRFPKNNGPSQSDELQWVLGRLRGSSCSE